VPDELWRPIPGHAGYEASSLGRVRSVPRTLSDGRAAGGVVLKPSPDSDGYERAKIRGKWYRMNILVQTAFAGPPEVRHLDGDHSNNKPENLAWGSRVENEQDKRKRGTEELIGGESDRPSPNTTPRTSELPHVS